jgi:two-component system, LytTR family, response regulator LytT
MKILIVEDEQHSREELQYLLHQLEPQASITALANAAQAWEKLEQHELVGQGFDVIFLDIQMPGMNGLELAARIARLNTAPSIVFATANPQHALTAFELESTDYVLKPYRASRLKQSLERVQKQKLNSKPNSSIQLEKIWAARGEVGVLLDPKEILYCKANGDTVNAHISNLEFYGLRLSLHDLELRFPNGPFARVHKSFLVNLDHVKQIEPHFSGRFRLLLSDQTSRVPLSRQYAKKLRERLGWF